MENISYSHKKRPLVHRILFCRREISIDKYDMRDIFDKKDARNEQKCGQNSKFINIRAYFLDNLVDHLVIPSMDNSLLNMVCLGFSID